MIEIYRTGYSSRPLESWVKMIKKHGIEMLVDVRSMGKDEKTAKRPEMSMPALKRSLPEFGLMYREIPELGGYRHSKEYTYFNSPNKALSKKSGNGYSTEAFRTYADYMYSDPQFLVGVEKLLQLARQYKVAFFCCEGWEKRCHTHILADYLTAFDLAKVYYIKSGITLAEHERVEYGVVQDGKLVYPA